MICPSFFAGMNFTTFLIFWGIYSLATTPLDAIPDLSDVQVMTTMRRGPLGTGRLNEALQEALGQLSAAAGDAARGRALGARTGPAR